MSVQTMMWLGFAVIMTTMFTLDMGVFSRKSHEIRFREALTWTVLWV
jgi:tellurite resistance protein TerC